MTVSEKRRHQRRGLEQPIRILWSEGDHLYECRGKCADISESGMCVETDRRPPDAAYVHFMLNGRNLRGTASVRRVQAKGTKYLVALEFTGGFRFQDGPIPPR